jgi:hypothetical protein
LFTQSLPTASASQTYTVAGSSLTGNITITPPVYFQVSLDGVIWQSTPLVLTQSGGTIAATTVYVRLNAPITGIYNSRIIGHQSANADAVNVTVNGITKLAAEYAIYPIPAYNTIFVAYPLTTGQATLVIYNASGQHVATYTPQPNTIETKIDIRGLSKGLYYLQYRLGDKKLNLTFIRQ